MLGGRFCCVPGCKINDSEIGKSCPLGTSWHIFPTGARDVNNRRERWIKAVNKLNKDGTVWVPAKLSKVCSHHFVDSRISEDPDSPSFVPTLRLPKSNKKSKKRKSLARIETNSQREDTLKEPDEKKARITESILDVTEILRSSVENKTECVLDRPSETTATQTLVGMANKSSPSARWGHSLCMINEGEALLIGGQGDRNLICKDSIWHLDLTHAKWSVPDSLASASGPKPESRMGHTTIYDPVLRSLYLFGGSKKKKWFSDLHILDIDEWKWRLVAANGKAPTRAYHSCNLYSHELWIFGGIFPRPDPHPDCCSNDLLVFSPLEEGWYAPIVVGEKPLPRSGHSTSLLQNKMVLFGGWDAPICYNDVHVLDMSLMEWSKPNIAGRPPAPRSWHSSCPLSGNRILIHGGYNGNDALDDMFVLNLDMLTWTFINLEPKLPARAGHTALCLPYRHENNNRDEVLIFGGGDNEGAFFPHLINLVVPVDNNTPTN